MEPAVEVDEIPRFCCGVVTVPVQPVPPQFVTASATVTLSVTDAVGLATDVMVTVGM